MSLSSVLKNEIFDRLFENPENKICFDCNMLDVKCCSINHGIFLCTKCGESHKFLLQDLSIIKFIDENDWSFKDLKLLISGGNSTLKEFLTYYDIDPDTPINTKYRYKSLEFYRDMLNAISDGKMYIVPYPLKDEGSKIIDEEET